MAPAFDAALASKDRYQWFADAADMGWTFAPVEDPADIVASPQTCARGAMQEATVAGRPIPVPALPHRHRSGVDDDPL